MRLGRWTPVSSHITITSMDNQWIKKARSLLTKKGRIRSGCFLLEGKKPLLEAITHGWVVKYLLFDGALQNEQPMVELQELAYAAGISTFYVAPGVFRQLVDTQTPQGVAGVIGIPDWTLGQVFRGERPLVLIVDGVQDPGNLGTLLRTALAAGAAGALLTKGTVDPYSPKTVRAAAGALLQLPVLLDLSLEEIMHTVAIHGIKVVVGDVAATRPHYGVDLTAGVAVMVGNEGQGVQKARLGPECELVKIPMPGPAQSLNVAVAAGIILFEAVRQRQE